MGMLISYGFVFFLGALIGGVVAVLVIVVWALVWGDETRSNHERNTLYRRLSDPAIHQTNLTYH
jgi:hypothetical protein